MQAPPSCCQSLRRGATVGLEAPVRGPVELDWGVGFLAQLLQQGGVRRLHSLHFLQCAQEIENRSRERLS